MNKDKVFLEGNVIGRAADTLGYQGLLVQLENLDVVEIDKNLVHKKIDEPQLIKLKDVIARIKELDLGTQKVWLNEILNELGSDYGTLKYKDGYEQGKLEGEWVGQQLKDADKIRQELNRSTVPQFMADWINYCKNTNVTLVRALLVEKLDFYNYANQEDFAKLKEFLKVENNQELFARAWLDGYEVEKENKYKVKFKNIQSGTRYLKYDEVIEKWYFGINQDSSAARLCHTKKELEEAGFGEVFNSPLFEVEEVGE